MAWIRIIFLTCMALLAFAANSLLCRLALAGEHIDAASFTLIRIVSGAVLLCVLALARRQSVLRAGSWRSALALVVYAAGFSFSYLHLSAGLGALILFGAVQVTMIGYGVWSGERLGGYRGAGLLLAGSGLVWLLLPGLSAPSLAGASLMLLAGVAWGVYSLRAKGTQAPLLATAGNFLRAVPLILAVSLFFVHRMQWDGAGIVYALLSGALASGVGYAVWYAVVPALKSATAATVQLVVPVIAAIGGVLFLQEALTLRLLIASMAILGGIALVVLLPEKRNA